MRENLAINGDKVVLLSKQVRSASLNLSNIPHLVVQIIEQEMWKLYLHPSGGQEINNSHLSFADFVSSEPPNGLGSNLQTIENILVIQTRAKQRNDVQTAENALKLFASELTGVSRTLTVEELPQSVLAIMNEAKPPNTISKSQISALRKLERERPDLLGQVQSGNLSANKAMIEAGFRKRRFSIPQDDVAGAANAIRNKYSDQQIRQLVQQLQG